MVWIVAGHYLIHRVHGVPYISRGLLPAKLIDSRLGMELVISKCSACHFLRDVMIPRQSMEWESIVNRMVKYAAPRISSDEGSQILAYLTTVFAPQKSSEAGATPVDQYCSPCHSHEYITRRQFDRRGWENVVRRMSEHAPDIVPPDKVRIIVDYLERSSP